MGFLLASASGLAEAQSTAFDARFLAVHGRRVETLIYDFTGDGVYDVLNASIDFDVTPPTRWLALHVGSRTDGIPARPTFLWSVHPTACALMFGDYLPGGGTEICTVAPDGVYTYPFEEGKIIEEPRKLIHRRTFFSSPSPRSLPIWMYAHDISGDGMDDLLLPTHEGYRVYIQTERGHFGKVSRLEADMKMPTPSRFPSSLEYVASHFDVQAHLPRVALVDIDADGRRDLVTISGDVLRTFFQLEPGEFRADRRWTASCVVETLQEEMKKDALSYVQVAFHDIDGDRTPDLVVTKIEGQVGLFDTLQTRIYIHFGSSGRGKYTPDVYIAIHGVSMDPTFVDMNGDGKLDCLVSRLRTDIVDQALKMGILGDVSVTYEVFQFEPEKGRFSESAVYSYDVRVTFDDIRNKGAASRPLLFVVGDLTGDGRPDQVRVNPKTEELEVHPGRDTRGLIDFDATSHFEFKLERYPKWIGFSDLNRDGRTDIMLYYAGSFGVVLRK